MLEPLRFNLRPHRDPLMGVATPMVENPWLPLAYTKSGASAVKSQQLFQQKNSMARHAPQKPTQPFMVFIN